MALYTYTCGCGTKEERRPIDDRNLVINCDTCNQPKERVVVDGAPPMSYSGSAAGLRATSNEHKA